MKKKWLFIGLIVLLLIPIGVWAASLFNRTVPSNVTISLPSGGGGGGNPNIQVYSNIGCTSEVANLSFGILDAGQNRVIIVYVKNTGDMSFSKITVSNTLNPSVGTITPGVNNFVLLIGQIQTVELTLATKLSAQEGLKTFNTIFEGAF